MSAGFGDTTRRGLLTQRMRKLAGTVALLAFVIIYALLQRWFMKGLTDGAIKF